MKIKFEIFTLPINCGDGSVRTETFSTLKKAMNFLAQAKKDPSFEGFAEDVITCHRLEADSETGVVCGSDMDPIYDED